MPDSGASEPDNTAVRTALWRALHVLIDPPPHVLEDDIGLRIAAPEEGWRDRPDMHPEGTKQFRASIVGRARFIEDLVVEEAKRGVTQYVILGAGLDTFAFRRPEAASQVHVFEVDQPGTQAWKRSRLVELGLGVPEWLHLVPVNFEAGGSWPEQLAKAGFDSAKPAVVGAAGLSMYLTREAVEAMLRQAAALTPGSAFVMSFLVPEDLADPSVRAGLQQSREGARASGTPFISFFSPEEMLGMARNAGFKSVEHVPSGTIAQRYFGGRQDGLRPPDRAEEILVART